LNHASDYIFDETLPSEEQPYGVQTYLYVVGTIAPRKDRGGWFKGLERGRQRLIDERVSGRAYVMLVHGHTVLKLPSFFFDAITAEALEAWMYGLKLRQVHIAIDPTERPTPPRMMGFTESWPETRSWTTIIVHHIPPSR
jgi:hypothetical protein